MMGNIEQIKYTRLLQEKKEALKYEQEHLEKGLSKLENEISTHRDNCNHIAFRFGGTEYTQGFVKCLLCGREFNMFDYMRAINLGLIVDANIYMNEDIINYEYYKSFDVLCEALFDCFQNKLLELCEKYPNMDDKELVAMLNQMIINDKQGALVQISNEQFQGDSSTTQKRPKMGQIYRKKIKGITHHRQGQL